MWLFDVLLAFNYIPWIICNLLGHLWCRQILQELYYQSFTILTLIITWKLLIQINYCLIFTEEVANYNLDLTISPFSILWQNHSFQSQKSTAIYLIEAFQTTFQQLVNLFRETLGNHNTTWEARENYQNQNRKTKLNKIYNKMCAAAKQIY